MEISRRLFLGGMVALTGSAASVHGRQIQVTAGDAELQLRFGVLTDTHIGLTWWRGINTPAMEKALKDFRARDVDAVMITGDITNIGTIEQLRVVMKIWDSVFPDGKGLNGKHVEKLFICGNHDVRLWTPIEKQGPGDIAPRLAEVWEEIVHEKFVPVFLKKVNGFPFVGAHWGHFKKEETEPVLKQAMKECSPDTPLFYYQHAPLPQTCYGSRKEDDGGAASFGTTGEALKNYPNAIVFSGHSHWPLSHPRSIWQGEFTAVNAGAMAWADFSPFSWPHDLAPLSVYGKSACIVSVYQDRMTIERRNVCFESSYGADWVLPLPLKRETYPYTLEKMTAAAEAPFFAPGSRAVVNTVMSANTLVLPIPPKDLKGEEDGILVSFPAARLSKDDDWVMYYEVTAYRTDTDEEAAQMKIYTEFYLGAGRMKNAYDCLFEAKKLPKDVPCRFRVCAMECFGKKSEPLETEAIQRKTYKDWV
jgi:predicted phosphodiesterase